MGDLDPDLKGMKAIDAREPIVEKLKKLGAIVSIEDYSHDVGTCYRCHQNIEPRISDQWFVAMKKLAEPAIKAIEDGDIKFVPKKPLSVKFFRSLDKACKDDSCCWSKDSIGYYYNIYPERPIDRTKGTHMRQVEVDGEMRDDWDGDFISVRIPLKGDTIYVSEGWCL